MISVDTNIIVRFLTQDDPGQYPKARQLLDENTVFVPETVVLETEWVLRYTYEYKPVQICDAFIKLFGLPTVQLAQPTRIAQAIEWCQTGMDFADALHLANSQQHKQLLTFDRRFVNKAKGCGNCPVERL